MFKNTTALPLTERLSMGDIRDMLGKSKRIVIKVGTSTLTYETGKINFTRIPAIIPKNGLYLAVITTTAPITMP